MESVPVLALITSSRGVQLEYLPYHLTITRRTDLTVTLRFASEDGNTAEVRELTLPASRAVSADSNNIVVQCADITIRMKFKGHVTAGQAAKLLNIDPRQVAVPAAIHEAHMTGVTPHSPQGRRNHHSFLCKVFSLFVIMCIYLL